MTNDTDVDDAISHSNLVGLLAPYVETRRKRDISAKHLDLLAHQLKEYLEAHDGEELWDGEKGIIARMQTRSSTEHYDTANMPIDLIQKLWQANALKVDTAMIKALVGRSSLPEEIKRWRVPGGVTYALEVKETK